MLSLLTFSFCYSTQLEKTVFKFVNSTFPFKNLPALNSTEPMTCGRIRRYPIKSTGWHLSILCTFLHNMAEMSQPLLLCYVSRVGFIDILTTAYFCTRHSCTTRGTHSSKVNKSAVLLTLNWNQCIYLMPQWHLALQMIFPVCIFYITHTPH